MKKCKQHVFLELVTVPESMWLILGFLLVFDLYLRGIIGDYVDLNKELFGWAVTMPIRQDAVV